MMKGGEHFGELGLPIKSTLHKIYSDLHIYNKWAALSASSSRLAYLNEKNELVSFSLKDLRNKVIKARKEAINVADFAFDKESLAILHQDGVGRFEEIMATGGWTSYSCMWTTILKLENCWLFIGWDLNKNGNHIITVDFDGQLKEQGYINAKTYDTSKNI